MKIIPSLMLAALAFAGPAFAGATAPAGLQNKTVTIVWGQSNTWRRVGDNLQGSTNVILQRQIYISSADRTFVRQQGRTGNVGKKSESGPENSTGRFIFDGNTMTNFMGNEGLLWHITVNFDPSFSSCKATVTIAREGKVARAGGVDGAQYDNLSATVGSVSCSVANGNAFAS